MQVGITYMNVFVFITQTIGIMLGYLAFHLENAMRILLADDHTLIRENLKDFLQTMDSEVEVFEASTLQEADAIASKESLLDIIILDLIMPGMNGLAGLKGMLNRYPSVPIAILSGSTNQDDILGALNLGAKGFLPKSISGGALLNAMRLIMSGDTYIPKMALADSNDASQGKTGRRPQEGPFRDLTPRERDVLAVLVKGSSNKLIARELRLSEVTVKAHLRNVFQKLGVSNRAHAVAKALELGWHEEV